MVMVRPMMFGSLSNLVCQTRCPMTASGSARDASSAAVKAASERERDADGREVIAGDVHRRHGNRGGLPGGLEQSFAAAPSGDDDPFAGRVAHVEIVREGPGVDDAIAGLRAQLAGRPDHQLGQTEALDARRRAKQHPQEEQDRDHHAHAQPEGDDADGGEGARPEEGARGVKQVRNESVHRCPHGVWVDTLDLSRAQIAGRGRREK